MFYAQSTITVISGQRKWRKQQQTAATHEFLQKVNVPVISNSYAIFLRTQSWLKLVDLPPSPPPPPHTHTHTPLLSLSQALRFISSRVSTRQYTGSASVISLKYMQRLLDSWNIIFMTVSTSAMQLQEWEKIRCAILPFRFPFDTGV